MKSVIQMTGEVRLRVYRATRCRLFFSYWFVYVPRSIKIFNYSRYQKIQSFKLAKLEVSHFVTPSGLLVGMLSELIVATTLVGLVVFPMSALLDAILINKYFSYELAQYKRTSFL